jgi:hypothetical protein
MPLWSVSTKLLAALSNTCMNRWCLGTSLGLWGGNLAGKTAVYLVLPWTQYRCIFSFSANRHEGFPLASVPWNKVWAWKQVQNSMFSYFSGREKICGLVRVSPGNVITRKWLKMGVDVSTENLNWRIWAPQVGEDLISPCWGLGGYCHGTSRIYWTQTIQILYMQFVLISPWDSDY